VAELRAVLAATGGSGTGSAHVIFLHLHGRMLARSFWVEAIVLGERATDQTLENGSKLHCHPRGRLRVGCELLLRGASLAPSDPGLTRWQLVRDTYLRRTAGTVDVIAFLGTCAGRAADPCRERRPRLERIHHLAHQLLGGERNSIPPKTLLKCSCSMAASHLERAPS